MRNRGRIHESGDEESKPKTLKQKLLSSVLEVMQIHKNVGQSKNRN